MLFCRGCHRRCLVAVDAVDSDEGIVRGEARDVLGYFFLGFAGAVCVVGGVGDSELAVGFVGLWMWVWVVVIVVWMLLMVVIMIVVRMRRRRRRRGRVIRIRHRCWDCYFSSSRDCDCDCWSFILALYMLVINCW